MSYEPPPPYEQQSQVRTVQQTRGLEAAASTLRFLAFVVGVGGLVGGIVLAAHSIQVCDAAAFGCGSSAQHPFVVVGIGMAAGCLVQAWVLVVIARLAVATHRLQLVAVTAQQA